MSAHQSQACCSVPVVVSKGYQEKGQYKTIDGLKTYVTGPTDAKSAILFIYDIFGYFPQTIQGADILSTGDKEHKHLVMIPDWFHGKPFDHADFPPDTKEKGAKLGKFFETTGDFKTTADRVPRFVAELRSQHPSVEKVFIVGFCWGGKIAALTSQSHSVFAAAAAAHPAKVEPADAPAVTIPFALLPSKDEDKDAVEKFAAGLKGRKLVEWFPTQVHGWLAARADLENEETKKEYQRGYQTILQFFHDSM